MLTLLHLNILIDGGKQNVAKDDLYLEMKQELSQIKDENLKLRFLVRKQELTIMNSDLNLSHLNDKLKPFHKVS